MAGRTEAEEKLEAMRRAESETTVELSDGSRLRKRVVDLIAEKNNLIARVAELEQENARLKRQIENVKFPQEKLLALQKEVEILREKVGQQ